MRKITISMNNVSRKNCPQLSVAEPSSILHPMAEHTQTHFYPQDWFSQPMGNYNMGEENCDEDETNDGASTSCSSPGEESYTGEDWSYSLELTDEYDLDGEVGKRLNQMIPIPHIPRIHGEIPSIDEATFDHQRLLDRLQVYELVEFKVQGDGHCQLSSCALGPRFTTTQYILYQVSVSRDLRMSVSSYCSVSKIGMSAQKV